MKLYMLYQNADKISDIVICEVEGTYRKDKKTLLLTNLPIEICPIIECNDFGKVLKALVDEDAYIYIINDKLIEVEIAANNMRANHVNELRNALDRWEKVKICRN